MRLLAAVAIFLGACGSRSPITCELVGDHVYAVTDARVSRSKVAAMCTSHDWSTSIRECIARSPSFAEVRDCDADIGITLSVAKGEPTQEELEKRRGLRIDLPSGSSMEIDPTIQSLVLEVPARGDVVAGGKAIADDQLENLFRAAYARNKGTQVVIKAERETPHARVVQLMERAKQAGLSRLAIGTRSE